MPQAPYDPAVGFQSYFEPPTPDKEPDAEWGIQHSIETGGGTLGAALRQNNAVFNFLDYATQPTFKPDPAFNLVEALKKHNYWDNDRNSFLGVQSAEEFTNRAWNLQSERRDRQTLAAAGWPGVAAAVGAGLVDPTSLLPLTTGGKGVRAIAEGAVLGLTGAAIDETALQASQVDRSIGETGFALGTATVLGGALGGAVSLLARPLEETAQAIDKEALLGSASPNAIHPQDLSAASARVEAGGLKAIAPGQDIFAELSPVVRTINQDVSPQARWMMQQLDTGGLKMEKNAAGVPTSVGGAVADRVLQHYTPVADVLDFLDEQYAKHWFGDSDPRFMGNLRAAIGGTLQKGVGKLTKQEFREAIAEAMTQGDVHPVPEVGATAKEIRAKVIDPMFEEGKSVGLFKDAPTSPLGDESYLTRIWDRDKVKARFPQLIDILARNFDQKMQADFIKRAQKIEASTAKDVQRISDIKLPEADADAMRTRLVEQLKATETGQGQELMDLEDIIAEHRAGVRSATDQGARKGFLELARGVEKYAGEPLKALRKTRAAIRTRLNNLTRNKYVFDKRLQGKLRTIDATEERSVRTLERLVRKGQRTLKELEKYTDEKLDSELQRLNEQFDTTSRTLDKAEAKLAKITATGGPTDELESAIVKSNDRLDQIFERIHNAETLDREQLRALIQEGVDEAIAKTKEINDKRAIRVYKLREQAGKLNPKVIEEEVARIAKRIPERQANFRETVRQMGGENIDLENGSAEFGAFAKERATEVARKLKGSAIRIPGIDILQGERGPELARLLDIPSSEVKDFLERDIEKVIKSYARTLAPDIEISRKFGSPNAVEEFRKLNDEFVMKSEEIGAQEKLSPQQKEKKQLELSKKYDSFQRDLAASIGRLRHTFGLPDDPDAIGQRLARIALNWNVLRFMGMVSISSLSDPTRAVTKYGLLNTMRDGLVPLITSFKSFRMSASEVRLAGTALDVVLHSRSSAILDVMDHFGRGSKVERGLEYATGKMGFIAAFDYWTAGIKKFTGVVINAQLVKALQDVVEKGGRKKSVEFLASVGIDGPMAERMWGQITNGKGGGKINGVWLPNTESWTDQEAIRTYRAALAGEVDDAIITPGLERPLWTNKTTTGRLLAQFRSFGFSSATKTVMAGLQARDLAAMNGTILSVGLGMLSYYLWAVSSGGKAYTEMQNADLGKWLDEGIDRSGVLGIINDLQRIGEKLPVIMNTHIPGTEIPTRAVIGRFSSGRVSRGEGQDIVGTLLGPTFDLGDKIANISMGLDNPTQSTAHQARLLFPFQNHFLLRQGFDKMEKSLPVPAHR